MDWESWKRTKVAPTAGGVGSTSWCLHLVCDELYDGFVACTRLGGNRGYNGKGRRSRREWIKYGRKIN